MDVFYRKRADGAAAASTIREGGVLHDWSPNGDYLWWRSSTGLWYAPAAAAANATMYLARQFSEDQPMLSPDGTLVAYTAAESGQPQVYLRPFPDATRGKWQVSYEGGREPRWRADGRELYYITRGGEETLRAVSIERIERSVRIGQSEALFRTQFAAGNTSYAVWPDGTSFLINRNVDVPRGSLTVVINWEGLLQRSQ